MVQEDWHKERISALKRQQSTFYLKGNNWFNFSRMPGEGIRGCTKAVFLMALCHRELLTLHLLIFTPGYPHPVPQSFPSMLVYASPFPSPAPFHLPLCCQLAKVWPVLGLVWSSFCVPGQLTACADPLQLSGRGICSSIITVLSPTPTSMDPALCESSSSAGLEQGLQKLVV